jgi:hypothetical protein
MSQDSHDGDVQGDEGIHDELPEITWVGDQRLMSGYCGRAVETPATVTPAESRPVAVVRRAKRSQGRVVRIGPPRAISPAAA